jgi:hypothetical protein
VDKLCQINCKVCKGVTCPNCYQEKLVVTKKGLRNELGVWSYPLHKFKLYNEGKEVPCMYNELCTYKKVVAEKPMDTFDKWLITVAVLVTFVLPPLVELLI